MFDDFDTQIQCEEIYEYGKYFLEIDDKFYNFDELSIEEKAEAYIRQWFRSHRLAARTWDFDELVQWKNILDAFL